MMRKLLIGLAALWAQSAVASHLLHGVPQDVADAIRKNCEQKWQDSSFEEGRCDDDQVEAWLQAKNGVQAAKGSEVPDLLIKPPKLDGNQK